MHGFRSDQIKWEWNTHEGEAASPSKAFSLRSISKAGFLFGGNVGEPMCSHAPCRHALTLANRNRRSKGAASSDFAEIANRAAG